ncbi:MAG: folate-binding protein [Proteobacteria bacterium]|nr:folate-binding protein [Pseudomonadota bacterium]
MTGLKLARLEGRTVLKLSGADVHDFLQNLITNDMDQVSEAAGIYAALLTAQGKFLHDFFILEQGDHFLLDVASDRAEDLYRRLSMYKLRADVEISDSGLKVTALFGDETAESAEPGSVAATDDRLVFADPRLKAMGLRLLAPEDYNWQTGYADAQPAAQVDYETHRLALGVPDGGIDILPEKNFLLEANFEELNGVSFTKGCYVGQELTARTKHRAKIKKRLFRFTSPTPLAPGDSITLAGKEVAEVRSTSDAGTAGIALTRIEPLADAAPADFEPAGVVLHQPDYLSLNSTNS